MNEADQRGCMNDTQKTLRPGGQRMRRVKIKRVACGINKKSDLKYNSGKIPGRPEIAAKPEIEEFWRHLIEDCQREKVSPNFSSCHFIAECQDC